MKHAKLTAKLICWIEPGQLKEAKVLSNKLDISMAEVVRRALANFISAQERAEKRGERSMLMTAGGGISEQHELLSKMREQKETQPQVAPQPTLAQLIHRIEELEQRARNSK